MLTSTISAVNLMCPRLAASLMLEISQGALHPATRDYMLQLLVHVRWDEDAPFGFGLPPGTRYHNKPGSAYNDLNDIAYIELPNGQKFVLAAFSDSLEYSNPWPYTLSNLGVLVEMRLSEYSHRVSVLLCLSQVYLRSGLLTSTGCAKAARLSW